MPDPSKPGNVVTRNPVLAVLGVAGVSTAPILKATNVLEWTHLNPDQIGAATALVTIVSLLVGVAIRGTVTPNVTALANQLNAWAQPPPGAEPPRPLQVTFPSSSFTMGQTWQQDAWQYLQRTAEPEVDLSGVKVAPNTAGFAQPPEPAPGDLRPDGSIVTGATVDPGAFPAGPTTEQTRITVDTSDDTTSRTDATWTLPAGYDPNATDLQAHDEGGPTIEHGMGGA